LQGELQGKRERPEESDGCKFSLPDGIPGERGAGDLQRISSSATLLGVRAFISSADSAFLRGGEWERVFGHVV
jgi:hypothetical protein